MVQVIEPKWNTGTLIGERFAAGMDRGRELRGKREDEKNQREYDLEKLSKQQEYDRSQKLQAEKLKKQEKELERAHELEKMRQKHEFDKELKSLELQGKGSKEEAKSAEELGNFENALQTVNQMRKIRKKENLGFGTNLWSKFGGETAKDKGQYEQLGKSLISLASNIPIRNQKEFEAMAHGLMDANISDAEAEGILDAMEKLIQDSIRLKGGGMNEGMGQNSSPTQQKERPPLTSFHR
jgi:hypothetical protein